MTRVIRVRVNDQEHERPVEVRRTLAEKLVLPSGPHEASSVDPVLGGMIEELYTCPRCGSGASRRAEPTRGE